MFALKLLKMKVLNKIPGPVALILWSVMTTYAQKANVTGNITGMKDTLMMVYYKTPAGPKTDTVKVVEGKFKWTPALSAPQKVNLFFGKKHLPLYVENSDILIHGSADLLDNVKITGSGVQDEANKYAASMKRITDQEQEINDQYQRAGKEERLIMEARYEKLLISKREKDAEYIRSHPKSFFSLSLVIGHTLMAKYEDLKPMYDGLDHSIQQTGEGKMIGDKLAILKRSAIGAPVLDFTQNDTQGKPVRFSDFKGKYVLVDFWASWCGPCRAENPNVLQAYNKYKDRNFTVVGISLDDKEANWKKAIKDDGMPWAQLSDLMGFKNAVSTYYGIQGIPSTLLVDPEGKIIAKDLRGEKLNKALEKLFSTTKI